MSIKKEVFISYSRKDTAIAEKICQALDMAGISYFIDMQGIGGGMEFPIVLAEAIINSKLFLFLASKNSYESKFTNSEITFAFNEKPRNTLIPYIIDDSELPLEMRFIFSGINWRNSIDHPIESVLVDDICRLLNKEKKKNCMNAERSGGQGNYVNPVTDRIRKMWELEKRKKQQEEEELRRCQSTTLALCKICGAQFNCNKSQICPQCGAKKYTII